MSCVSTTVLADHKAKAHPKTLASCTTFDQKERDDDGGVDMTVTSTCDVKVSCGIKWALTCSPGGKKERTTRAGYAFDLEANASDGTTASADACGNEAWQIADVSWSCEPSK